MIRVVKEPHERRQEIIEVGEQLFMERGYENTSVEAIIKQVGIAKGTFYHYFKTKEDMLNEIMEKYVEEMKVMMDQIMQQENLNAVQKIFAIFNAGRELREEHKGILDYVHEDKNELFHHRLEKKNLPIMADYFEKIIAQGV
ncbi:MAG: TetR/AcrR family transcriptional regulator, partial [Thermoplasmata archaeon]